MLVITMERKTLDGKPVEYGADENGDDYRDWWCVIETKEEEMVYDRYISETHSDHLYQFLRGLWDSMVKHAGLGMGIRWGEDDIYGYIRPDEMLPEVGDEYTDGDGDTWVRVE